MIRLNVRALRALAGYADMFSYRKPQPHPATHRALLAKKLIERSTQHGTAPYELTDLGKKTLEDYGGGAYIRAKYDPPDQPSKPNGDPPELRAAAIAAAVVDGVDVRAGDLQPGEWAGWIVHEYDSSRGDLEDGESAGYLARQIVEHDEHHVEPVIDRASMMLDVLKTIFGVERVELIASTAHDTSRDPVALIRRAIDEHLVKLGRGADVQRMQSPRRS